MNAWRNLITLHNVTQHKVSVFVLFGINRNVRTFSLPYIVVETEYDFFEFSVFRRLEKVIELDRPLPPLPASFHFSLDPGLAS